MYLLRVVDNDVLGLVNVRLFLLYNTVLFLVREPMRKANILRASLPCFVNIIWLCPLISVTLSGFCILLWSTFSSSHNVPLIIFLSFPFSAVIESIAEPFAVISLRYGIDREALSSLYTLFGHSVLKQIMTDGSAYVMTFTELLSLKSQAVYDAVEKVGSLVARIVLAPIEEMCFAYFSNAIHQNSKVFDRSTDTYDSLVNNFTTILHVTSVVGLVISVFGLPYSPLAVSVYGGNLLYDNGGATLLSLYCVYLSIMAVNGITECFAMASMNNSQVLSHGGFLFISAFAHVCLSSILCSYFNAAGFIIANSVNMLFRIVYSWRHISSFLGDKRPSITNILPTTSTFVFLVFSLMATLFTLLIFGSTPGLSHTLAHAGIGGVLFVLVVAHIVSTDHVFQLLTHRLEKYAP
ncbi:Rft protein [Dictyocaulus viviparus]|uniref:Protein RFT1 homolog n=1 Tax=Dictyocaulus viviparus TaxID=29172 RepID=A0A0D8XJP4_DICVI|nr:Rft protein [Dictyocaulus viviparus]